MGKIVFFMESKQTGGGMLSLLRFAFTLAEYTDHEVYYINFRNDPVCQTYYNSKIHFCDILKTDFKQFDDATFFMPLNYLFIFLSHAKEIPNAKILLYSWHPDAVDWMKNNTGLSVENLKDILVGIKEKSGCIFMDEACRYSVQEKFGVDFPKWYLPVLVLDPPIYNTPAENNWTEIINIGWLGRLDRDKAFTIINLLKNIQETKNSEKVVLHLIGDGNCRAVLERICENYNFEVKFLSSMYGQERDQYIVENIDLMVAMGLSALETCFLGVPTVFATLDSDGRDQSDKYVFLYDTAAYCLGWNIEELKHLNFKTYSLDEVLTKLTSYEECCSISAQSRKFAECNFSMEEFLKLILQELPKTKLTVQACFRIGVLKQYFEKYYRFERLGKGTFDKFSKAYRALSLEPKNNPIIVILQRVKNKKIICLIRNKLSNIKKRAKNFIKSHQKNYIISRLRNIRQRLKAKEKYEMFMREQEKIPKKLEHIKFSIKEEHRPVKVAFFVIFASSFQYESLFQKMAEDKRFAPKIVVIPNHQRGVPFMTSTYWQTYNSFSSRYPSDIVHGYDFIRNKNVSFDDNFDIIFYCSPYASMICDQHKIQHFSSKNVLTFFSNYSFEVVQYWKNILAQDFTNYLTTFFIEVQENCDYLCKYQCIKGTNSMVVGYSKMDEWQHFERVSIRKRRKTILLCPHHTVRPMGGLLLSNFLKYYQFFLELPKMYPDIDFIFRPHPLLFPNLLSFKLWSQQQIDQYLAELLQNENVIYSTKGEYFEDFAESDAIIHDCGSFVAEYLYTEKPCCFLFKNPYQMDEVFLPFGRQCLEQHYKAYCQRDITDFIDCVVIEGEDSIKDQRCAFSRNILKKDYPNTSTIIIKHIEQILDLEKA